MSPPLTPPFASTAAQPAAHAPTPAFAGFDFLPFFGAARSAAASEPAPGLGSMGPMGHWAAPVYDVDELDKRIRDLRTVHFWLEQNTKALALTIQTLEVQKMTLVTLKSMNLGLQEIAQAFTPKPQQNADAANTAASPDPTEAASVTADALQWWNTLSTQFQTIATDTLRDLAAQAGRNAEAASAAVAAAVTPTPATDEAELPATPQAGPEVDRISQAAPAPAPAPAPTDATPHASVAPQTAPPKPRKRPPPAPRAARASS